MTFAQFIRERRPHPARLAQNLFAADAPARRLVAAARLAPGDVVYDLGAGTGRVTAALLAAGARVVAVERDPNFAGKLRARFGGADVRVMEADLADVPFRTAVQGGRQRAVQPDGHAAAPPAVRAPAPESATLVLQREAAERYAGLRTSALSLMAQPWFDFAVACPFGRRDFVPCLASTWPCCTSCGGRRRDWTRRTWRPGAASCGRRWRGAGRRRGAPSAACSATCNGAGCRPISPSRTMRRAAS